MPDKKILEHDRLRSIEVEVMEERERLEEENERIEAEGKAKSSKKTKTGKKENEKEEGEQDDEEEEGEGEKILSDEEIDSRCEKLRAKLLKEMEEGAARANASGNGKMGPPRDRRNLKSYQVHELAQAKIEESERLRRALGIKEDRETGQISSGRFERRRE